MPHNFVNKFLYSRNFGELSGKRARAAPSLFNFADNLLGLGSRFAVVHGNVGPLVGQSECDSSSDSLCRSRNQNYAALQFLFVNHAAKVAYPLIESRRDRDEVPR